MASNERNLILTIPDAGLRAAVGEPAGVEVLEWDLTDAAPAPELDLVVQPYLTPLDRLRRLDGVRTRLVQSQSIGYDGVAAALPAGTVFANAASVHETSTAELTLALILAAQRGIPEFVTAAASGRWPRREFRPSLADRRVLLLGTGGVGEAIAARLAPFEVDLVRVASRARTDDRGAVHGADELAALLPDAEIVVVGLPLTDATRGIVDRAFLARMPDGALLVNIGRGPLVDTDALLAEVASGRLRAALDVTDPEPLPAGHPLLGLPNVLISPHVGGASSAMVPRMARLVLRQLERLRAGLDPLNVVLRT